MRRGRRGMLRNALVGLLLAGCSGSPCEERRSWLDRDGDGFGDPGAEARACEPPPGSVAVAGDCDDGDPEVHPGVPERCDGVDQDCDGLVDDDPDPPLYADDDGDGYGDPAARLPNCDAWGVPDATDCDDADPALNPSTTWYEDGDGDGVGGREVGRGCEAPGPGDVPRGGDCDDDDPDRTPGAPERCDGVDQDCVDAPEGADTWAFPGLVARIPLEVEPTPGATTPLVLDVDLAAALRTLGLDGPVDPASLRLAVQGCGTPLGEAELPVELVDGARGLLSAGEKADPTGDAAGAVVALWDRDGDAGTVEPWPAGPLRLALYFQGDAPPSTFASDLRASATSLSAGGMVAALEPGAGGLLSSLALGGASSVASQADAPDGNGVLTPSGPLRAQDVAGATAVLDDGSITAAVAGSVHLEDASGGLDLVTTYRVFAGRAALLVTPREVTTSPLAIHGATDRSEPLRPVELATPLAVAGCESDPDLRWADLSAAAGGVTWAWVAAPRWVTFLGCDGEATWTSADDLREGGPGRGADGTVPEGKAVVDEPVMVLLPHGPGGAAAAEEEREAWRAPVVPTLEQPETWRR